MTLRRMKPLLLIFGLATLFLVLGWTWSERPRAVTLFAPTWTRSYLLYGQPHAVWLDQYQRVGANLDILNKVLKAAAKARQVPELVVYAIPMRDLGQSSEGGFADYETYLQDNRLNADLIHQFVKATEIHPVVYLEPDSIPLAVQYRRDHNADAESRRIYADRIRVMKALIALYRQAGARVYLEGGHSGWFDYGDEDVQRIATALNEAGIQQADGLATNVSNRQPVIGFKPGERTEAHYLARLLPLLNNKHLDVRVDTSRNGGPTKARQYYLHPDGHLLDNETPEGRLVGQWKVTPQGEIRFEPFFGKRITLTRLTGKEKYTYDSRRNVLTAPAWLDAVGDVQLGPAPTDATPAAVANEIGHYRYIKPPDDCDGALNCPPGHSKHDVNEETQKRQLPDLAVPPGIWKAKPVH
ncbi:MAG: nanG [Vampirovibrio sp.]|jgi:hypothetical protein|nr:nanG [Vampirovibrio sp.]